MSENPPDSPKQPAGQISPDGNYVWDGSAWQPRGQGRPTPAAEPPPRKKHTARNVLLVLVTLMILFFGGCLAILGLTANEVDKSIKESEAQDKLPGGPDNPLEIHPGKPFDVYGFKYQPGWTVKADALGDVAIRGLKFKNTRDKADSALVEIRITRGNELVASADCTSDEAEVGQTVTLKCISADDMPTKYDKITINDTF